MMPTIAELIAHHGFDTDKATSHSYGPVYDRELASYRDRPGVRLLEIGVHAGGSIRLWRAYFDAAEIVGVDTYPPPVDLSPIATIAVGDAYTEAMAASLGDFDIIIDDGDHNLVSMLAVVRLYLPRLRPGGLMVIEDVQRPDWFDVLSAGILPWIHSEGIDLRHVRGRADDALFVVRRPA